MVKKVLVCALACLSITCHVCSAEQEVKKESTEIILELTVTDETLEKIVQKDGDLEVAHDAQDDAELEIVNQSDAIVEDEALLSNSLFDGAESEDESLFDAIADQEEELHDQQSRTRVFFHRCALAWVFVQFKVRYFFKKTVPSWFVKNKLNENSN